MARPRVALLVAAHDDADTRRNFRRELDADLAEFHLTEGERPEGFEFDGAVVTGSRASVYDDEAWIDATRSWVGEALERELPTLGVCWGHQLLADVLGGEVGPMEAYELGYRSIRREGDSQLLAGVDEEFVAFTTHSDEVVTLPPGATRLAANDRSIHAFRCGSAYGVQFHPEYDLATAESVTRGKRGEAADELIDDALAGIEPARHRAACKAKALFDNFLALVEAADGVASGRAGAD